MATLAVPGLVIDKLFELWLYRAQFDDLDWLKRNFDMVWSMTADKQKPKWIDADHEAHIKHQTQRSVLVLFGLLHEHGLLGEKIGIQTEFHVTVADGISIAGAIDMWSITRDNRLIVVDFKNYGSASHRSVDQLHLYALALEKIMGRAPDEAGYVCFHPRFPGYRKTTLRPCDRNRLLARIRRATEERIIGKCKAKYNAFTCPRFCEVRNACPIYLEMTGRVPRR